MVSLELPSSSALSSRGGFVERLIFGYRPAVILLCVVLTLVLGFSVTRLRINASYEKAIPQEHPYVKNYLANKDDLVGLGNTIRLVVAAKGGSILTKDYLTTLASINDELFLLPGVDRAYMKSLWTPSTRWTAVTEDGLDGGPVIPESYDGSSKSIEAVRVNIERSGEIGQLVDASYKSSAIVIPLLERKEGSEGLDYLQLSLKLESIRQKYKDRVDIRITGFAKVMGDLLEGLSEMLKYFGVAVGIAGGMIYVYNRDIRSTILVLMVSLLAVLWLLGLLPLMGYQLNPYSILVPFLIFAIGVSHGAQKMNGIMQDIAKGATRLDAAKLTFRRLFLPGLTALLADAVGFAVLLSIQIPVIKELAITASIGVALLILTNLILLPILLSYVGVSAGAAKRSVEVTNRAPAWIWKALAGFTQTRRASIALGIACLLAVAGHFISDSLRIGDLDAGAPELRHDSRYNKDYSYVAQHYAASSDILVVMVKTPENRCTSYDTLSKIDRLSSRLEQLDGVEATNSMAALSKFGSLGYNEGNVKWYELIPNERALGSVQTRAPRELFNQSCTLSNLYVYLKDHKSVTLQSVVDAVEDFSKTESDGNSKFLLAAGSAGIESATNIVVKKSWRQMLVLVYAAVAVLCYVTFRSFWAVLVALLPLMLTSVLAEALMVILGMGVKVATLPVIALGVGIGVDYALYILSVTLAQMKAGKNLSDAYAGALGITGRVVMLTGLTLAIGVATWAFSDIKFQADMGVLLAFMFVVNMLGALVLVPSLARFLLRRTQSAV